LHLNLTANLNPSCDFKSELEWQLIVYYFRVVYLQQISRVAIFLQQEIIVIAAPIAKIASERESIERIYFAAFSSRITSNESKTSLFEMKSLHGKKATLR